MTIANAKPDLWMTGPLGMSVVNSASSLFHDATSVEMKITAAYTFANAVGAKYVYIPSSFEGFDATQVTTQAGITALSENQLFGNAAIVVNPASFPGVNGGAKIQAAAAALPATGGIVDARGLTGTQIVTADMLGSVTTEKPIKFMFGPSTWSCQQGNSAVIMSLFGSNIEINLHETKFILNDGTNQSYMFYSDQAAGNANASVTNGSATITLAGSPSRGVTAQLEKCIGIAGHTPDGGRDNTTLNGAIDNVQTTSIVLTSITGQLPTNGWIRIDNEIISYTSFSGNTLVGAIRGVYGSTAASHLNNAVVDRVVWNNYTIKAISGLTLTLDRAVVNAPTMTAVPTIIGPADCSFTGTGTLDGGRPASDVAANGVAVQAWFSARLKTERGIVFQHWDHGAVNIYQSQGAVIDGSFFDIGTPSAALGFSILFFQGCRYCTGYGDFNRVNQCITTDDRTSTSQVYDNQPTGSIAMPRQIRNSGTGVKFEGSSRSYALIPYCENWGVDASPGGAVFAITAPQWVTAAAGLGNFYDIGYVTPTGVIGSLGVGTALNHVYIRTNGATVTNAGAATNIIITNENGTQPGLKFSSGIGIGVAPGTNIQVSSQAPTTLTQTIHQIFSPDATVNAYGPRVFNAGSAAVPVLFGANSNNAMGLIVNGLSRWLVDTSGRFVPDTTNGGARLERSIALVSGTTPALDASLGNVFTLTILTNIAVVVAVPTNPPAAGLSQRIRTVIRNGSGGALTTPPTFNTAANGFKLPAITNPANGTEVIYDWQWDVVQSFWYPANQPLAAGL